MMTLRKSFQNSSNKCNQEFEKRYLYSEQEKHNASVIGVVVIFL